MSMPRKRDAAVHGFSAPYSRELGGRRNRTVNDEGLDQFAISPACYPAAFG
jgi:hypothetical protein